MVVVAGPTEVMILVLVSPVIVADAVELKATVFQPGPITQY